MSGRQDFRVVCEYCGRVNRASDLECEGCGAPLPEGITQTPVREQAASAEAQSQTTGAAALAQPAGNAFASATDAARAPGRSQGQISGCLSLVYFLTIGWCIGLFWLELGLIVLFTIVGIPLAVAFWKTAWSVATLRRGQQTMREIFGQQWEEGKSWYERVPAVSKVVPYWLALVLIIGLFMVISESSR